MNKKKENREEIRNCVLTIQLNEAEKRGVQKASNEMGVTMSSFARIVLNDFLKKGKEI